MNQMLQLKVKIISLDLKKSAIFKRHPQNTHTQ